MKNKRFLLVAVLVVIVAAVQAKVRLPHIICDNMVLQQLTDARLWGWAKENAEVKVTTSWDGQTVKTKAGSDGRWLVRVQTPAASYAPYTITFDDGEGSVEVKNVLAGEV